ncbi:RNA polymerase sigma factor [Brucellaceae bacterium C25G]
MSDWSHRLALMFYNHRKRLENKAKRSVNDKEAAADIVQEVFTRVLNSSTERSTDDTIKILYTATRNAAIDHIRTSRRQQEILKQILPEQMTGIVFSPETLLEDKQSLQSLDEILLELGKMTRDIFLLRRVYDMPNADIARKYSISVSAVEKHIARAMRHCQKRMSDLSK